ncbi:MAG: insulinase family protein [Verrucomicrobiota bacterium]
MYRFLALPFLFPLLAAADPVWPHDKSDLPADTAITWGQLENGLRFAILPNPEPPDRVSLRIHFAAGSLMETEEQRGLAHFLEHMAFNGTENFPAGEMVEYFQRLGMSFGGDTNAFTSFDQTAYQLELPNTDEALLRKSLLLLRDYAERMDLSDEEIDKERGVILSEKVTRDSVDYRTWLESIKFALPDSLISKRSPIGLEKVIKESKRDRFLDFYKKYYTPERTTIVATGAVDPKTLAPLIEEFFGDFKAPSNPSPEPDLGKVTTGRGIIAKLHTEKEASTTEVTIDTMRPISFTPDNSTKRRDNFLRFLANSMINERLQKLAKTKEAPFTSGRAYAMDFLDFVHFANISLNCQPDQWQGALNVAEQEIRRALEHGFTQAELDEARAKLIDSYEESAKSAPTRKSRGLADQLVSAIHSNRVFMHPQAEYEFAKPLLESVTVKQCQAALRKSWAPEDRLIFVAGNLTIPDAPKAIVDVYKSSTAIPVEPPVMEEAAEWAYTDFGPAGKIAHRREIKDLGVTQIRFENNVRLNLLANDFEKDTVRVSVRVGNGELSAPPTQPGLSLFASNIVSLGGLEAHSNDEMERILAGKTIGRSFAVSEDAFTLTGATNEEDLLLQMQVLAATLSAPGYREEALTQFSKAIDPLFEQVEHTPMGVFQADIDSLLKGHDPRLTLPERSELEARTMEEVKAWLAEPFANGFLEIGIVGDLDKKAAIDAVAKTFGALSPRAETKDIDPALRQIDFPSSLREARYDFESKIPKGLALVVWPTTDMDDIATTRRLSVLGSIFADRLRVKVREELGEAYSPYARNSSSGVLADYGYLFAFVTISPDQADSVLGAITGAAEDLFINGTDADELDRALKPLLSQIEQQRRSNSYWLGTVVAKSQSEPRTIEWARSMLRDFKDIKVPEINRLAKEYFDPAHSLQIVVNPSTPTEE